MIFLFSFFFNDTATTEIYTLSLHDALPISRDRHFAASPLRGQGRRGTHGTARTSWSGRRCPARSRPRREPPRSEEHTSELQSQSNLVCRLLLEKKKKKKQKKIKKKKHKSTK